MNRRTNPKERAVQPSRTAVSLAAHPFRQRRQTLVGKQFWKILLAFLLLSSSVSFAQKRDKTTPSEPQDLGVLLFLKSGNFVPLELKSPVKQDRSHFFSATSEEFLVIPGPKSPIRFKTKAAVVLYLRVLLEEQDPRAGFFPLRDPTRFRLVRLDADQEQRRMSLVKSGLTYTDRQVGRPLLVRLYGENSFQLSPSEALEPGEYAIKYQRDVEDSSKDETFDLFCFGLDS